ncbi:MAG: glycerophosphodiester phosphodiesterase [Verrucomicrobiota bacterium]
MISPAEKLITSKRPLVIGHRGYSAMAPENTLPSFQLAIDAGADLVELDYQHSKDGIPMVIHDATLGRTTNSRQVWKRRRVRVARKTAAEIQILDAGRWFDRQFTGTKIPTLSEALDFICGNGSVALIEQKSGKASTLVDLLREKKLINRVIVISFDWRFLRELHELEPRQIIGALGPPIRLANGRRPSPARTKRLNVAWMEALSQTGAKIAVWNRQVSQSAIRAAHQRKLAVWIYTIDDTKTRTRLIRLGCDGIISNTF